MLNFLKGIIHALIEIYPHFNLHHISQVHVTKRPTMQYTSLLLGYRKMRKYILVHIKAINLSQLHLFNIESINHWFSLRYFDCEDKFYQMKTAMFFAYM